MSKSTAAIVGIWFLIVVVGTVAVLAAHWVDHRVWARAEARARWVPHTEESPTRERDGSLRVRVTVQLVATSLGRRRVVESRLVGECQVRYPGDPDLLELEALAMTRAETRNMALRER